MGMRASYAGLPERLANAMAMVRAPRCQVDATYGYTVSQPYTNGALACRCAAIQWQERELMEKVKGPAVSAVAHSAHDIERMKLSQEGPGQAWEQWENDYRPAAQTARRLGSMWVGLLSSLSMATRIPQVRHSADARYCAARWALAECVVALWQELSRIWRTQYHTLSLPASG